MLVFRLLLGIWILDISSSCDLTETETCLSSPQAITHNATGDDIEWETVGYNTYHTTIVYDATQVCWFQTSPVVFNNMITTKLFNNSLPSQTIRMKRGKTYKVTVVNNLGPESEYNPTAQNVEKDPNTTNIHTHGLHIGGSSPGDNVFIKINPGENYTYTYNIPCDHAGGTFWWHPHHHGATHLQVAAGAAGLLIIEDDAEMEGLASWYTEMEELLFFISHINFSKYTSMMNSTWDYVWTWGRYNTNRAYGWVDTFLVNGQYRPTVCMTAGKWIKFRMGQIETTEQARLYTVSDECTLYLLARDGVMVHGTNNTDMPRLVGNQIFLAQSSRADVAIFCPGDASGTATYNITTVRDSDGIVFPIAYIEVNGTKTEADYNLTAFSPVRPHYLENLMEEYYEGSLETQQYLHDDTIYNLANEEDVYLDYWNLTISGAWINSNRDTFSGETNWLHNISVNTLNTWKLINQGAEVHPVHVHVNHFQLLNSSLDTLDDSAYTNWVDVPYGYQEPGDFFDTIWGPGYIRFKTDIWAGTVTIHCHILIHEDQGAMGTILVTNGCDNDYNAFADDGVCDYVDTCGQFNSTTTTLTPDTTTTSDSGTTADSATTADSGTTDSGTDTTADPTADPTADNSGRTTSSTAVIVDDTDTTSGSQEAASSDEPFFGTTTGLVIIIVLVLIIIVLVAIVAYLCVKRKNENAQAIPRGKPGWTQVFTKSNTTGPRPSTALGIPAFPASASNNLSFQSTASAPSPESTTKLKKDHNANVIVFEE